MYYGAMPGPAPSSKPDRKKRPGDIPWTELPPEGRAGPPPAAPYGFELEHAGATKWIRLWQTPEASQWGAAEKEMVARLCQLHDEWVHLREPVYDHDMWDVLEQMGFSPATCKMVMRKLNANQAKLPTLAAEMRMIEERLGLTAKARKELRWRISGEVVETPKRKPGRDRGHLKPV